MKKLKLTKILLAVISVFTLIFAFAGIKTEFVKAEETTSPEFEYINYNVAMPGATVPGAKVIFDINEDMVNLYNKGISSDTQYCIAFIQTDNISEYNEFKYKIGADITGGYHYSHIGHIFQNFYSFERVQIMGKNGKMITGDSTANVDSPISVDDNGNISDGSGFVIGIPGESEFCFEDNINGFLALLKIERHSISALGATDTWISAKLITVSDVIDTGYKTFAKNYLENKYGSDKYRGYLQTLLGYDSTVETATVSLNYKEVDENKNIINKTYTFNVDSKWAQNKEYVLEQMRTLTGFNSILDFNVNFKDYVYFEDGIKYQVSERILLQAEDLTFTYNENKSAIINVVYSDFQFKDFCIRVKSNSNSNLKMDVYTVDVVSKELDGNIWYTLTFNYANVSKMLLNGLDWIFELNKDNFVITNNASGYVDVVKTNKDISISFRKGHENYLSYVNVVAVAEIIEDYDVEYAVDYDQLVMNDRTITSQTIRSNFKTVKYSQISYLLDNLYVSERDLIFDAVNPAWLNGNKYYEYKDCTLTNLGNNQYVFDCNYKYTALIMITTSYDDNNYFIISANPNTKTYKLKEYGFTIPNGYRVESIECASDVNVVDFNVEDYKNINLELNETTYQNKVFYVHLNLSDMWLINVNYLKEYKDTPFMELKNFSGEVKLNVVSNPNEITAEDIAGIVGMNTMNVHYSTVDSIKVEFDGKITYTVSLSYTYYTIRVAGYEENSMTEQVVPLTSFKDWCDSFEEDWSILFLNRPDKMYFMYSNDIARENLYGYFTTIIQERQSSDQSRLFEKETLQGCATIFKKKTVRGTWLYKMFKDLSTKSGISGIYGIWGVKMVEEQESLNPGMAGYDAELTTYFTYIDCTNPIPFLALNGANDVDELSNSSEKNQGVLEFGEIFDNFWKNFLISFNYASGNGQSCTGCSGCGGINFFWLILGLLGAVIVVKLVRR